MTEIGNRYNARRERETNVVRKTLAKAGKNDAERGMKQNKYKGEGEHGKGVRR